MNGAITAIVVSYADPAATRRAVQSLLEQEHQPVEVLVVDNDPHGRAVAALSDDPTMRSIRVIHPGLNLGYTRAVNLAAARARGDWLFLLNPDAIADARCLGELLAAGAASDVAVVGAQVLLPDGRVNAGDNPVNVAGVSWAGGYGRPREHGPTRDTAAVSGAALLVRRSTFVRLGGLCPHFFMYVDDTDLAWRVRMSGRRVRFCPAAVVVHDYEFQKGAHKWFYIERNRLWALASNLQLRTLVLLAPVLVATEVAVTVHAISQGWLAQKIRAWTSLLAQIPRLVAWRRSVQAARNVSDYRVLTRFLGAVEIQIIGTGIPHWANRCLEAYRGAMLDVLARWPGVR